MTYQRPRLLLIATLALLMSINAYAQNASTSDPLGALPTSDIVAYVDLRRILTEIVPRVLANDPATLAKMTNTLNELNAKTGINLLSVDRIAGGLQFVGPATHEMKKQNLGLVIIAHGDFNANALIAFIKRETNGKLSQETYGGKIIYSEPQPAPPKKKDERETAACTILDANTIVVGDLPQVRATIDAATGKGTHADSALVQLAQRDPVTLIGMAGNVPASLVEDISSSAPKDDQMAQALTKIIVNIKQIFSSLGATATDFNATFGARLTTAEQAQSMSDTLLGMRQQVSPQIDDKKVRDLVESIQITAQGDEVMLKVNVPNEAVQDVVTSMIKENQAEAKKPVTRRTTKPRRGRRRRH